MTKISSVFLVAALSATAAAIGKAPAVTGKFYLCDKPDFKGACSSLDVQVGKCVSLPSDLSGKVSALRPDAGFRCFMYSAEEHCSEKSYFGSVANPGVPDLSVLPGNKEMRAFRCEVEGEGGELGRGERSEDWGKVKEGVRSEL